MGTLSREATLLKLFFLPSEKGSSLKEKKSLSLSVSLSETILTNTQKHMFLLSIKYNILA